MLSFYAGVYTRKQISAYWDTCKPGKTRRERKYQAKDIVHKPEPHSSVKHLPDTLIGGSRSSSLHNRGCGQEKSCGEARLQSEDNTRKVGCESVAFSEVPRGSVAPMVTSTCVAKKPQAEQILDLLCSCYIHRSLDPYWANRFWIAIHDMEISSSVQPAIMDLLCTHGYAGPRTLSPPIFDELEQELIALTDLQHQTASQLDSTSQGSPCPSSVGDVDSPNFKVNGEGNKLPWDTSKPLSLKEVQHHASHGDEGAAKALAAIQRLATEKQGLATCAWLHRLALQQGRDQYLDPSTGYMVFTSAFLRKRKCCGFTCRHCPHRFDSVSIETVNDW